MRRAASATRRHNIPLRDKWRAVNRTDSPWEDVPTCPTSAAEGQALPDCTANVLSRRVRASRCAVRARAGRYGSFREPEPARFRRMTAVSAANVPGSSCRQVHRLLKRFRFGGPASTRDKARGRVSNKLHGDTQGCPNPQECFLQPGAATGSAGHQPRSTRNSANSCCVNVTSEFLQTAIVGKVASRSLKGWRTRPLRKMFSAHVV